MKSLKQLKEDMRLTAANSLRHSNHFALRSITKKNIPFMIGWVIVFIWLYSYFLPFGGFKFESDLYNFKVTETIVFTTVWLITTPLITVFADGRKYVPYTFISVAAAIASFIVLRLTPAGAVSNIVLFVGSACMGHIFASSCYSFFMVLNNSEKFYSMLLAVFLPKLLLVFKPLLNQPDQTVDAASVIIIVLLFILLACSFLYRRNTAAMPERSDIRPPRNAYVLMLLVFAVLALNDVIAPAVISAASRRQNIPFAPFYFSGAALGVAFILIFQKIRKTELYNILNLSFAVSALGFVSSALGMISPFYGELSFFFFGLSYVLGFVNIYYLAGFLAKKFQSVAFYRIGIVLSSVFYVLAILVTQLLTRRGAEAFNDTFALSAFLSVIILILFLFLTPFFIRNLSSKEWMDDTYRIDITHETRLIAKLKEYNLSPREIETCRRLLEGYTLRQITAIMGISFSTVNTYCNSIYKKMNINSRTELLVLLKEYGVE